VWLILPEGDNGGGLLLNYRAILPKQSYARVAEPLPAPVLLGFAARRSGDFRSLNFYGKDVAFTKFLLLIKFFLCLGNDVLPPSRC
jgi:hypothetical protein